MRLLLDTHTLKGILVRTWRRSDLKVFQSASNMAFGRAHSRVLTRIHSIECW